MRTAPDAPDEGEAVLATEVDHTTRRRLLALLGASGAAVLASQLAREDASAQEAVPVYLGQDNVAEPDTVTQITGNAAGMPVLVLRNDGGGGALNCSGRADVVAEIHADGGPALYVENTSHGEGAFGPGEGVEGIAHGSSGVEGASYPSDFLDEEGAPQLGIGVRGLSHSLEGGYGDGPGVGVQGSSGTGTGVQGISSAGVAIEARADSWDATALQVLGKVRFTTGGSAIVAAGDRSVYVNHPAVTDESHISVTFVSDPGNRQVRWIERDPGNGFTVHLTTVAPKQRVEAAFTYLITEPITWE